MTDKITEITTHDYEPINQYIDEKARIRRTRSFWGYSKSAVLIMVGVGLLAVLLAWAYYLYKKPHRLVSLDNIQEQVLQNEERLIDAEKKLPSDEEVNIKTGEKLLQEKINKKNQEILKLKSQMENNKKAQEREIEGLKREIENNQGDEGLKEQLKVLETESQKQQEKLQADKKALENETKRLEDKLTQQVQVQTDVIHFKHINSVIGGQKVRVWTRLEFDDPKQKRPTEVSCYLSFNNGEYANVEFGTKENKSIYVSRHIQSQLSLNTQDFIKIRNKYCQYDY
tara:strand:- start:215 stop:1066 length:852 start_codon:yes stop_codon:yes gene_type:complete